MADRIPHRTGRWTKFAVVVVALSAAFGVFAVGPAEAAPPAPAASAIAPSATGIDAGAASVPARPGPTARARLASPPAASGTEASATPTAPDPVLEARMLAITNELRCLVCQNQTIAESHADLAVDLRAEVRELLRAGRTPAEIRTYMTD